MFTKYLFRPVPDPHGDGFVKKYIEAYSEINPDSRYYLEIDYDLCAPMETWTLIHKYTAVRSGISFEDCYRQQVYHGKELTGEQIDMLVDLVMLTEENKLNFGEFVKQ